MADDDVLTDDALGDQVALLQTPALANVAAGGIGPDPSVPQPKPAPVPLDPTRREKDERWRPEAISVVVQTPDGSAFGKADLGGKRTRLSDQVTLTAKRNDPAGFWLLVRFYVDATNMSRRPPFTPPQVGVAWKFMPDGGDWGPVTHLYDPSPLYVGPGLPLRASFGESIGVPAASSGWWTVSGRIEDAAGSVEFDDVIRCLAQD
jgi:hypothetical protein